MATIKFYLRNKKVKNKSEVRVSVSFKGLRLVFGSGVSVSPSHWDFKRGLVKVRNGEQELSLAADRLSNIERKVRQLFFDFITEDPLTVFEVLKKQIPLIVSMDQRGNNGLTVVEFLERFIEDCEDGKRLSPVGNRLEEASIKPFRSTLQHLKNYSAKINSVLFLKRFRQETHDDFLEYLEVDHNLSRNTASKYIMCLKQLLDWAVKQKLIQNPNIDYATSREDSDNIYLNESELKAIMEMNNFKTKMEEHVRDLFVIGSFSGLRWSNYSALKKEDISNGNIQVVQVKTKSKVQIPIHPYIKAIFEKYNYQLPKSPTNQEFNRTLKDICQRVPELDVPFIKQITRGRRKISIRKYKWEMVMSHTARRNFCTNMFNLGVPILTIMAFSGHSSEKSFRRYVKSTIADHTRIIEGYWNGVKE